MGERLYRAQILLEPEQHRKLVRIAGQQHRSLSEIIREIVQAELDRREKDETDRRHQLLQGIERVRLTREEILARRAGEPLQVNVADMVRQMRDERDEEVSAAAFPPRP
jgi:predicted transcriptional regulator